MQLLFIADPIASFKIYKDTTFAMMREAQARGHVLWVCEAADLHWRGGIPTPTLPTAGKGARQAPPPLAGGGWEGEIASPVTAVCRRIELTGAASGHDWYRVLDQRPLALREVDAVLMRKDPPFDSEYFYATHLLQQAEREGAAVFNSPRALRDHPEKLAILEFPQFITPTLVSRRAAEIKAFYGEHGDVILKPLDGMGGTGIFRLRQQADGSPDPNLNVVIETITAFGATTVMAQRFVPAIAQGDKRVLIIDGEPVPYCLARIPQGGETRGNLAAGGLGVAQPLSDADWTIARALGPVLAARGLLLVGIDIIGDKLTEINVTSPTCFQEITQQSGCDVAARFVSALESAMGRADRH